MKKLFENIKPSNKGKILKLLEAHSLTLPKNVNLFTYVKNDNFIALVEKGNVQIIKNDYSGNRTIIEDLKEQDVFGTMISTINSNLTEVITKEETLITIIDYNRIFEMEYTKLEYYNQFVKNLLEIITEKVQEKNERIEILTKKSIRNKLLSYFQILATKTKTRVLYLPFTFTELADYLAVDRCAMSRELKYLKEEGFIQINNRIITLLYR